MAIVLCHLSIFCSCRPSCSDVVMVYRGVATLERRLCGSYSVFEIAMGNRIATVIFRTDAIQGTGTGFRIDFSSEGMSHSCASFVFVHYTNFNSTQACQLGDWRVSHSEGILEWLITGTITPNQPATLKQCLSKLGGGNSALLTGNQWSPPQSSQNKRS